MVAILLFAYFSYRSAGDSQLAAIGILAFAAIAQLAPAFFGGLIWRNATAGGAIAGMTVGILTGAYTRRDKEIAADFEKVYRQIKDRLTPKVIPVEIPVGEGPEFHGIINLFSRKCHL